MNEWEGWTEARVVADLRRRFGSDVFPHNTTVLYYNRDVEERLLAWGALIVSDKTWTVSWSDGHVTWHYYLLAKDAEYRVLWHTAGSEKPEELRELAAVHREKVRRGEVPPWLRGVV